MERINLLGHSLTEMENLMLQLGEQKYKGRQLYKWVYHLGQYDFSRMTDLKLALRQSLSRGYHFSRPIIKETARSLDGTEKYLFELSDAAVVEAVMIPEGEKRTVCLSTQTGCPLGCRFCATGQIGPGRNLSTGEIVGQLLAIRERFDDGSISNIVFMGMGEPLLNLQNVLRAVDIFKSSIGLMLSAKKQTISTVGIIPKIYHLADSDYKVNLAISLHAATDEKRVPIIPIAATHPLERLIEAVRYYTKQKNKRITFEYILFKGLNDAPEDALALARLVRGIPCKINLLAYNPVAGLPFKRPDDAAVDAFGKILYPRAPAVTVRKSRGRDIQAACGQLAGESHHAYKEENDS
jgi:23S rRNA (adenine2503-C2)-methyltransferase